MHCEQHVARIGDRLQRLQAAHELNMQYLIMYGVSAEERHVFRDLLLKVVNNGSLTLRETTNLAREDYLRNGSTSSESLSGSAS